MHMGAMMAMHEAMKTMAMACYDECMKHAETSEAMRMCAQACMDCANACDAMMKSMSSASM